MDVYAIADLHLEHRKILEYQPNRPWSTVEEHDEALIEAWNAQVRHNDEVHVVGDFSFGRDFDRMLAMFNRFRGRKHLDGVGNHDDDNPRVLRLPWERVNRLFTWKVNGQRAVMCHYPIESWAGMRSGAIHIHGHSHGRCRTAPHRFDVGVDAVASEYGFAPVPIEDLFERARSQGPIDRSDRHAAN